MEPNYGYKHTKGFLVFFLLVLFMSLSICFAQVVTGSPNTPSGYSIDSTTGNLIQNPTMTSGTGWTTSGMVGSYTPDGYIFSYSSGTIQQDVNLGSINFGYQNTSAVFATGIMYGFKYRFQCANSIGSSCEAGTTQDTLNATFTYSAANGTVEQTSVYQLGLKNINDGNPAYNPVWQQLAETYTFAGAKPINTVGTARLSITGMDNGFWGCNPDCYGPQIKDAYVRLNYSVDPCILNPAFNPNCPGFQNVLQGSKSPTFYYSYNIAQSLPHIGGGVILHGYDYGFNWYNYGACYNTFMFWCTDWRTDGGGNINFRISDKNNTTMLQQQWYVAGNNSGGSYSNRHLFTESRNSLDMGSVQWWTSDVWNHFGWVGWTRPVWTPDPCYTNGLYSPNCSNFQDTLTKVIADIKEQQDKISAQNASITSSSSAPGGTITTTVVADPTNPSVVVTTDSTTSSLISPAVITTGDSQSDTTALALSLIRNNERREQTTAIQASRTAIDQASQQAQRSQREAETIADTMQQVGQASSNAAAEQAQQVAQQSSIVNLNSSAASMQMGASPQATQNTQSTSAVIRFDSMREDSRGTDQNQSGSTNNTAGMTPFTTPMANVPTIEIATVVPILPQISQQITLPTIEVRTDNTVSYTPPQQIIAVPEQPRIEVAIPQIILPTQTVETPQVELETPTASTNFITNRTNPITEIIEGKPQIADSGSKRNDLGTVNKSAANNELAGGVSIESIAVSPQGFNVYASLVLRDAAFYAPKEIYRGQRNVDNVRALRNLAQDSRHQEMIEQQYRR